MKCIKGVIFDFGGVLAETCWNSEMIAELDKKSLEEEGIRLKDNFKTKFVNKLFLKFKHVLKTGIEERMEDIIKEFLEEDKINYNERAIKRAMLEINKAPFCKIRPNVERVLRELKEMGIKLGVISNTPSDFPRRILESEGLLKFFDVIVLSCEVKYRKPLKEIYKIALDKLNLLPEEVMFVGDTLQIDIKGAKSVGMIAVYIAEGDPEMRKNDILLTEILGNPPKPDFIIRDLDEIVNLVKSINERCKKSYSR